MTAVDDAPDWRARAACLSADPDLFFPISTVGASRPQEERAKAVCAECEVRPECLQYALESSQAHGVWGGLGEAERGKLRRARQRAHRRRAPRPSVTRPAATRTGAGQRSRAHQGRA